MYLMNKNANQFHISKYISNSIKPITVNDVMTSSEDTFDIVKYRLRSVDFNLFNVPSMVVVDSVIGRI